MTSNDNNHETEAVVALVSTLPLSTLHCLFSRAILCYLVNKYGQEEPRKSQLYPADPETRALVDRLLFFDNGTLYKNIVDYFVSINLSSTK